MSFLEFFDGSTEAIFPLHNSNVGPQHSLVMQRLQRLRAHLHIPFRQSSSRARLPFQFHAKANFMDSKAIMSAPTTSESTNHDD